MSRLGHLIHEAGLETFAGTSSPIPSPVRHSEHSSFISRASDGQDIEYVFNFKTMWVYMHLK